MSLSSSTAQQQAASTSSSVFPTSGGKDKQSTDHLILDRQNSSSSSNKQQNEDATSITINAETEEEKKRREKKEDRKKKLKFIWDQALSMALILTIDVGIPLALYYATRDKVGYVIALVIGGIPPILFVIYKFWRQRKVDIVGCIFVVSFIGSAVLSLITGDVRIALFRDATVDILISLIFSVTLIPIHTKWLDMQPLCYLITAQMLSEAPPIEWVTVNESTGEPEQHSQKLSEWMWEQVPYFRKFCYITTALWGIIMMADFVIKAVLILGTSLSIDQLVVVNNILQIVITVVMTTGTLIGSGFLHKRVSARSKEWQETHPTPKEYEEKLSKKSAGETVSLSANQAA